MWRIRSLSSGWNAERYSHTVRGLSQILAERLTREEANYPLRKIGERPTRHLITVRAVASEANECDRT